MADIIGKVAWPIAALLFGVFVVLLFYRSLSRLIPKINTMNFKDKVFVFGQARSDSRGSQRAPMPEPLPIDSLGKANWQNTGNLYWLGHDLMWTMQMALRGAPITAIRHGLNQSFYHTQHLDLTKTPAGKELKSLLQAAIDSQESDWDGEKRDEFAYQIELIRDQLGSYASEHQPGFEDDL